MCQILKHSAPSFTNHQHHSAIFISGIHRAVPLPHPHLILFLSSVKYNTWISEMQFNMQWGGTDVYISIAITQITAQNISITPCVSFQTNPFSQKGNHYSSTFHCDKFIALVPALASRNKILWPLAHLWWFHVPLEFESIFFWNFILKTCNFSLSFFPFAVIRGGKSFSHPSTLEGKLWPT